MKDILPVLLIGLVAYVLLKPKTPTDAEMIAKGYHKTSDGRWVKFSSEEK